MLPMPEGAIYTAANQATTAGLSEGSWAQQKGASASGHGEEHLAARAELSWETSAQ